MSSTTARTYRILVAAPERLERDILAALAKLDAPFEITRAGSPDQVKRELTSSAAYDILITGRMSDSSQDREAVRTARAAKPALPIVVVTDSVADPQLLAAVAKGTLAVVLLSETHQLADVIRKLLTAATGSSLEGSQKPRSELPLDRAHSEEALQFLADASEILSSSLDYEATLMRIAQLAVPRIADWCTVDIVDESGSIEQLALAHVDPEKVKWAKELNKRYPPDYNAPTGVAQVIRTGEPEFYPEIPQGMLEAAAIDEEHARIIRELHITSAMVVPLIGRNIVFGAITFISAEAQRKYTELDLRFAEDLGRRAGLAVDNAWLYQKAQEEIADRRETEEALRESEARYRIVSDSATDAIVTIDESSEILFVNPAATKIFGYSAEQMLGQPVTMLMPEALREQHLRGIAHYLETGRRHLDWESFEIVGQRSDGREIQIEISFGELAHGESHLFTAIIRDITERKRVEAELRRSEARFRAMIEQSPLGIQIFDLEGRAIKSNRAFEKLWNIKRADLAGYSIRTDPQLESLGLKPFVDRAFLGESVSLPPFYYDTSGLNKQGRARWVRVFLYPVKDEAGQVQEVAIILEDITDRKLAEEELRRAKELAESNERELAAANDAKDHFLAILSHELRTPLTPVMAIVESLQLEEIDPEFREWLEIIQRNVELEARLIDDLLDLTRITRGKLQLNLETVDVHALLRNVLDIYRSDINAKQLTLTLSLEAQHHYIRGDAARLQQIFWNLVKNAVKFTGVGGKLSVYSTNIREEGDGKELLKLEFTDTGIGIEPHVLPRIFDAFEQGEQAGTSRNFGGLGLGLAISNGLTEMHGGKLSVHSKGKNLGATFTVEFATAKPSVIQTHAPERKASPVNQEKPHIMLVDDHVDTSLAIRMLLERQGYQVTIAHNGADAEKLARDGASYDLIISDIGLPDESGLTLIGKLRALHDAPAIALSGFGTEEDVARSKKAGFDEHLTKPFNLQKLRETITRLLARS